MQEILRSYLNRLTNLSGNNRSLLLLRLPANQFIDLRDFEFLVKDGSFKIIESLISGKEQELCPLMDSRDDESNAMSRKIRKLDREDRFIFEERGSKDLYVGWPFVHGKLANDTIVRAPLLFFPVEIRLKKDKWILVPRNDSGTMFNKSFLLAYSHYNQIKLDEDLLERTFDDFEMDSAVFRTSLYQLLKESNVELHFNQDTFMDNLISFEDYRKEDYEKNHSTGKLKLYSEAVIGIFPQAGSYLVPDYIHLLENEQVESMDEFFEKRAVLTERAGGGQVHEEKVLNIFPMDAHQEKALQAVKQGFSIVVEGPPGTGKSQLICNLIADHMAAGKKVLVVSQKRAALDIVYQRLAERQLGNFVGLVHDFRNDRKEIYSKISGQIDRIDEYQSRNNGLDAIQLERNFLQTSRMIDQLKEELEEFRFALFNEQECGRSIKELYLTAHIHAPSVPLKQEYTQFRFDELSEFSRKLNTYSEYLLRFRGTDHIWNDRISFAKLQASELKNMQDILDDIPKFHKRIEDRVEKILGHRVTLQDCELIYSRRDFIVEMLGILKRPRAYRYFRHMMNYPDQDTNHLWLSNIERVMMECYTGDGPEKTLKTEELGHFQESLQQGLEAHENIFKRLQWRLFSREKAFLINTIQKNGLEINRDGFNAMAQRIDNRLNLEHNLTKLRDQKWLGEIPDTYDKVDYQNWFHVQKLSVKAKLVFNSLRNFKEFLNVQVLSYEDLRAKLEELFVVLKEIPEKRAEWLTYLTPSQVGKLVSAPQLANDLSKSLDEDFDALCEYDRLRDSMLNVEIQVIERIVELDEVESAGDVENVFMNSLRLAWIDHIETKYPVLRSVSSRTFHKKVAELQQRVDEKLDISNDMLLLRARERMYEHVEYNRLNNRVTYRDLYHQVTKKRRVWPLRKVISEFQDELFDLMPCWLASPEAVSSLFPMQPFFDLVIFDEASQCFVEKGIPAMYRGRQLVVAGDDKQLRPNDLYQVRFEGETNDILELEIDSLLELSSKHLMQVHLKGHYRSKSLDLIDFSNRHFYNGNLILLPEYQVVNSGIPAIEYHKVDGVWDKNTNDAEAAAISDMLISMIRNKSKKDVGVVTFNARQQEYIQDMLDERLMESGLIWPDHWFVKNIENVQGDEKDIIIFSIGYAPDKKGKMSLQFGSLNAANGENRLNVAVTRAREKVILVSSILPQQLKTEKTKNEGPKLLKKYLEYAWEVSEGKFEPMVKEQKAHPPDWYLKSKLMQFGEESLDDVKLTEELPFSDLTAKHGKQYVGLILTDDERYFQAESIKDRHVYLPRILSDKNWYFTSFFSREYWQNPGKVNEALVHFVNLHKDSHQ